MSLLLGRVDALLITETLVYNIAKEARADHRIQFFGESFHTIDRVVVLHQSRAELMPAVNAAIARMEADGRLEALRQRYNVTVPPPPPEVPTVGLTQFPPFMIIDEDGKVSGFFAEAFQEVSNRATLSFEFKEVDFADYVRGPLAAGVDALPAVVEIAALSGEMDFTTQVRSEPISPVVSMDDTRRFESIEDLQGIRVGGLDGAFDTTIIAYANIADVVAYPSLEVLFDALAAGEIDVIVTARTTAETLGLSNELRVLELPVFFIDTSFGLRPGLGAVRERLNTVIPGYLLSDAYAALQQKYFGKPVFWTRARIIWFLIMAGAAVLLNVGGANTQNVRARAAAAAALVRDELDTIFNAASSGIVAFGADGQIARINNRARHFLGGLMHEPPFAWPDAIKFLDVESLQPLDNSADPIHRALARNSLTNEAHLMRRPQDSDDQRYDRIEAAKPENADSAIKTVLVIDDISNEERNRQVVERKSRLDALGQLTGGIAHDFNNLLASLVYSVDLAKRAKTEDARDTQLITAMSSLVRGRALTSRLLSFARKQPGLASTRKTSEIFEEFHDLVRPMLEAQVDIAFTVDDPGLRQYCDPAQFETGLMNLKLNARDAILRTGKGNRIDVRARAVTTPNKDLDKRQADIDGVSAQNAADGSTFRYVEISVADNGPGMDDEALSRCKDPFFTTKDTNSGTGLGLAMVYGFIRQSESDLRIYSEEGVGKTVQMTLPRGVALGGREEPMQPDDVI